MKSFQRLFRGLVSKRNVQLPALPAFAPFEILESRVFLSGNVLASVVNGNLNVTGGSGATVISLDQTGLSAHQVRIAGTGGTTINHHSAPLVLNGITGNILIQMGNAADSVTVHDLSVTGSLSIDGEGGVNNVTLDNLQVASSLNIHNAFRLSTTSISNTTVDQNLNVIAGSRGQNVSLQSVQVHHQTRITSTGKGVDVLKIDDSTFRGVVWLTTGQGADTVLIDSRGSAQGPPTVFRGPVAITLHGGNDTLQLGIPGQSGNNSEFFKHVFFRGGPGTDTLHNFGGSTYGPNARHWITSFEANTVLSDTTPPTVVSVKPTDTQTNVSINKNVTATFSEAMDPFSLATNFTVTRPNHTVVAGTLSYNAASKTESFLPSSNLDPSTTFTATISGGANGAQDLAGNPLASDMVWTFTTGSQVAQTPINLGSASTFAVMATAAISGTGSSTHIEGDVGLNPGSAQGISPSQIHGTIHIDDAAIKKAQLDLASAYQDAVSRSLTSAVLPGNMGGLTFTPGLYTNSSSVEISGVGSNNDVTLDAQGDANAVFIFKMGSTLTTGPGAHVVLAGNAQAKNIFWQVGSSATLDTTTIFKGNILANVTITVNNGSAIVGRLLAGSNSAGSVTINGSTVTVPA